MTKNIAVPNFVRSAVRKPFFEEGKVVLVKDEIKERSYGFPISEGHEREVMLIESKALYDPSFKMTKPN